MNKPINPNSFIFKKNILHPYAINKDCIEIFTSKNYNIQEFVLLNIGWHKLVKKQLVIHLHEINKIPNESGLCCKRQYMCC